MKTIASFTVNHDVLKKGLYISRIDGDVVTYDVRMKVPNAGDYLPNAAMHTLEHLLATFCRNSKWTDQVIYVGPMGCRTGFYVLLRDSVSKMDALGLIVDGLKFTAAFEGDIPGAQYSRECGNYLEHDLAGAKAVAEDMIRVLADWNEEKMKYEQ